ncbi:MAG: hypothetical protein AB7S26_36900 [Sandaracinaceae bacterium]
MSEAKMFHRNLSWVARAARALSAWAACTLLALAPLAPSRSWAQSCGDGSSGTMTIPTASSLVLNTYLPSPNALTNVAAGATTVPVDLLAVTGAPVAIAAGDLLIVIQMQGAQIDGGSQTTTGGSYGDGPGGSDRQGVLPGGFVVGTYEYARAAGAPMAGSIPLTRPLRNAYVSSSAVINNGDGTGGGPRRYQVVRVPEFVNLTINGTLTGTPWNGRAGGVVAVDVIGSLVVNDNGVATRATIDASGLGYRGGTPVIPTVLDSDQAGVRGEGVAGTPTRTYAARAVPTVTVIGATGYFATTPPGANVENRQGGAGNAGGVPVINDSGGGGGGGFGDGGEGAIGPGAGGTLLPPNRSRGGRGIDNVQRLFMGGGGGSGTLDDPTPVPAVSGQAGGGLVFVRAFAVSGTGDIRANGDGANMQAQEGSGGGGGGGNVIVDVASSSLGAVVLSANGGAGTSTGTADDAGGGGGGGGRVIVTHPLGDPVTFSATVTGGPGGGAPQVDRVGQGGGAGVSAFVATPPGGLTCADPDTDRDGVPDFRDDDDDNDGILDARETSSLFLGDPSGDADGDGVPNWQDRQYYVTVLAMGGLCPDVDSNGVCDSLDAGLVDADGDGIPNHLDRDADRDGITDVFESGGLDANGDGIPDNCVDVDLAGICLNAGGTAITVATPPNTDATLPGGDAIADYLDPDSDADGLSDAIEAHDVNGNGVLAGAETVPVGNDHDRDGIDDAYDSDCTGVGTPPGCMANGDEITVPLIAYRDQDGDGRPDWLETCGDAYVRGTEACDTAGASASCTAACLLTNGQPCVMGTQCASMTCNPLTMTCQPCSDTSTGGVDMGCTAALPACVLSGSTASCRACEDDQTGTATDDGCGATTPICHPTLNVCRACLDSGAGVMDLGCTGTTPVCNTAGTGSCVACENDNPGTTSTDRDFGCAVGSPFCSTSGPTPSCVQCLSAANCGDANQCTTDVCSAAGMCTNPSSPIGTSCGTGDACNGTGMCVDCVNDRATGTDSGCSAGTPLCDAAMGAAGMCVECLSNSDCPAMTFCNPSGMCTPGCASDTDCTGGQVCDTAAMMCVACLDSMTGGGIDNGCTMATPVCAGASGPGTAGTGCVECLDTTHCATGVCDTTTNTCEACVDDGAGGVTDTGCMAPTPICDTTGAGAMCVECIDDDHCAGLQICTSTQMCTFPDTDGDGVPDDIDIDDDNDGIVDTVEGGGRDYSVDTDGDGIPDYADPDEVTCTDADANGSCDALPFEVDFDGDGIPNHADLDADGDGLPDSTEGHDANMDGIPDTPVPAMFMDMDNDGLADAYDPDNGGTMAAVQDSDGDGRPDFLDGDSDDDGIPDRREANDLDGDGVQDVFASGIDADRDGIDDAFDPDQGGRTAPGPDHDADGRPDYVDVDSDGDGIEDERECADPTRCPDTDGDGAPDYLDLDADGDGVADSTEGHDANMDGLPDRMPSGTDMDMDGLDDAFDPDSSGTRATLQDSDGDGVPDWRDPDDDGDLRLSSAECPDPFAGCPDSDADGTPDYLDRDMPLPDMDMDGIPDDVECMGNVASCVDTDGDGMPDHMDDDDDGDGVPTRLECPTGPASCDRDGDGHPNHLDIDSDDDGIPDGVECTMAECEDTDGDGTPDLWDLDTDNDGIADSVEGHDANMDGVADRAALGMDTDGDGLDDAYDPDDGGMSAPLQDTDADGLPDWRDADDDGDGIATGLECRDPSACPNTDGDANPDYLDPDGAPIDTDGDGIPDVIECPPPGDPVTDPTRCRDSDGDGDPDFDDPDDDDDGIPTRNEVYDGDGDPTDDDTDGDGIPDYLDRDDDNDGIPTAEECPSFMAGCVDSDGDGTPNYLDVCGDGRVSMWDVVTSWEECDDGNRTGGDGCDGTCRLENPEGDRDTDMDGLLDSRECPPPANPRTDPTMCPDTDGDGHPDFDDPDDDGDSIPTATELGTGGATTPMDTDGDGIPDYLDEDDDNDTIPTRDEVGPDGPTMPEDSDGDGRRNYLDPDDDDDGIPTATEVREGNALPMPSDDVDGDGVPNWLDVDSDGDGILDRDEPNDADGNGIPDYLEAQGDMPSLGGLSGGALCGVSPTRSSPIALLLLGLAGLALGWRRRR